MVREIVGHSDIEVKLTIYAHVSLEEERKALGKLGGGARLMRLLSPLVRGGGPGQDRTVDLPLFRRISGSTGVHHSTPEQARRRVRTQMHPWSSAGIHSCC